MMQMTELHHVRTVLIPKRERYFSQEYLEFCYSTAGRFQYPAVFFPNGYKIVQTHNRKSLGRPTVTILYPPHLLLVRNFHSPMRT